MPMSFSSLPRSLLFLSLGVVIGTSATYLIVNSNSTSKSSTFSRKNDDSVLAEDIVDGVEGLIGDTKLVRIRSLSIATGCEILAKAEFLNPGGSPKDRVALAILNSLGSASVETVYEGTSGSTGISLTMIASAKGYKSHILLPEDSAMEKVELLGKLGAIVERVKPASIVDKGQFVNLARRRAEERGGLFADQFENEENWKCHARTTGPEIYRQCGGKLDAFVSGSGTGGTISGISEYLLPRLPNLIVVLADPQGSGLYNSIKYGVMYSPTEKEGTRRRHQVDSLVEGIGLNRLTKNFQKGQSSIHEAVKVTDAMTVGMGRWLIKNDGLFVGSSSCVNLCAAVHIARQLGPGHRIVTILCDSGARHLSKFYNDEWLKGQGIEVRERYDDLSFLDQAQETGNILREDLE